MSTKTNPAPVQNDAQPQPGGRLPQARRATLHSLNKSRMDQTHTLPASAHTLPTDNPTTIPSEALPVSAPLRAPLLSLSPDDLAALDRAAQRVEELNRHVMKEIGELHVEILERVDLRRVQFPAWEVMSEFIFYSLFRAVELPSGSLEREKNPALALKMLAGALGNR